MLRSSCDPRHPFRRRAAGAEQALEHFARIDLHGQRRGVRSPRQRVHVDAAVIAIARAEQAGVIFGRQFERRQYRFLAEMLRGDLIRGHTGVSVHALRRLRTHAAQPGSRTERVNSRRIGRPVPESTDDVHAGRGTVPEASG